VLEDRTVPTVWAFPDSYSVVHDHVLNAASVLTNDMNTNPDPLTAVLTSGPSHGSLTFNSDGTFRFTPEAGYVGADYLAYKAISDGEFCTTSVTINITNTTPTAMGQSLSVGHDQVLNINLLANANDADGDTLQANIVSPPTHGVTEISSDGTYNYYSDAGWTGSDSFTFNVTDGIATSSTATINLSVGNTAPTASSANFSVEHDQVVTGIDLNQYVADAEGDQLTISIVSGPSHGQLTQNEDGTYIYTPTSSYVGLDQFSFKANDGLADSSTGYVYFNVTQYAPTSNNTYSLLHDHTLPNINFAQNDMDAMLDPTAVTIVSGPSHGTLVHNADGTYNYTPDAHYYGSDSVTIVANGGSNVVVTFNIIDHAPVAKDTSVPLEAYNGVYTDIAFLANVTEADNTAVTFDIVSAPQHGSLSYNSSTGLYDYTATTGYLGRDSFSVRYYDGAQYSQTVNTDILVYDDTTNFGTDSYVQGFPDMPTADTRFNGAPSPMGIRQGDLNDCWFVAAAAGLANAVPGSLQNAAGENSTPIIFDVGVSGAGETYRVTFPGRSTVTFDYVPGRTYTDPNKANRQMSFSSNPGNGDWAAILEQAWAYRQGTGDDAGWPSWIKEVLDRGTMPSVAIRGLTGNSARERSFRWSDDATTANMLRTTLGDHDIIVANTIPTRGRGHGLAEATQADGSRRQVAHSYTVLEFDTAAHRNEVHLRNPWGFNQPYSFTYDEQTINGRRVTHWYPALGGGVGRANGAADFWLPLADFTNWFSTMSYEY
jgi:hypothetical protein